MARPNSYKTRRQLVHCRIDVVTTRRNVVVNPSYHVQNPQKTRVLSYSCRDYSKKCGSKSFISRHYTVLCHSMSYTTRNNSHYVTIVDRRLSTRENLRQNVYENCTTICGWVTVSLREKLRLLWTLSCGEIFKPFKNPVGSPRQCTRYGDMLREQPTWGDISSTFLRQVASS